MNSKTAVTDKWKGNILELIKIFITQISLNI